MFSNNNGRKEIEKSLILGLNTLKFENKRTNKARISAKYILSDNLDLAFTIKFAINGCTALWDYLEPTSGDKHASYFQ